MQKNNNIIINKTTHDKLDYENNLIFISEDKDWQKLRDINKNINFFTHVRDSYHALRSAENGAKGVLIDLLSTSKLIRAIKDVDKFDSFPLIYINIDAFPIYIRETEEKFLKHISKEILEISELKINIGIVITESKFLENKIIKEILKQIFNFDLYIDDSFIISLY